jgi:lexA repressor|uniref:Repressor protein CI n=1 Tax=Siphoviridae sp. ctNs77 TaxID=2825473 RepID=A0A8S5QI38_9CAUD|nr:MAG TPA: Repressor protein CI [Siphoviridae sp. ctNs77]
MFKDKIRFYRKLRGISQEALADKLGYKSFTTIQKWEDGTSSPPIGTVKKVADILGVTIEELTSDDNHSVDPDLTGVTNISFPASRPIPILGDICAGEGIWCEENFEGHFFIDSSVKADFCVRVRGDSMIDAGIRDGDLAFIKRTYDYKDGNIYAVRINSDCEAVLKKVFWQDDTIILNPCNAEYKPIVTDSEGVSVVGECIGVYHATK